MRCKWSKVFSRLFVSRAPKDGALASQVDSLGLCLLRSITSFIILSAHSLLSECTTTEPRLILYNNHETIDTSVTIVAGPHEDELCAAEICSIPINTEDEIISPSDQDTCDNLITSQEETGA